MILVKIYYQIYDKKLLAIIEIIKNWCYNLKSSKYKSEIDCNNLC